jgi:2-keto-3-deoxy-L-rhamnonate aldolase RhmA
MKTNPIKQTLQSGRVSLGTMVFEFSSTGIGRLAGVAGAEFVIYDMEHTGWTMETIRQLMATSRGAVTPMVRVPNGDYHFLARALDVGAMGVMIPMVETVEQARRIADATRYPPIGRRGAAFAVAHDDYAGGDLSEKIRSANQERLVIAQIETKTGLENVEAIAAVEGIDILWVGQFDLSNFLGIPGQFQHPDFTQALARVVAAAKKNGKWAGYLLTSVAEARPRLAEGFNILAYGGDLWLYQQALSSGISAVKEML